MLETKCCSVFRASRQSLMEYCDDGEVQNLHILLQWICFTRYEANTGSNSEESSVTRRLINDREPIVVNFTNIITFYKKLDMKILVIIIIIIIIIIMKPNKPS
jgi:hypothetical protein